MVEALRQIHRTWARTQAFDIDAQFDVFAQRQQQRLATVAPARFQMVQRCDEVRPPLRVAGDGQRFRCEAQRMRQ